MATSLSVLRLTPEDFETDWQRGVIHATADDNMTDPRAILEIVSPAGAIITGK
jgi:hypothetical protein